MTAATAGCGAGYRMGSAMEIEERYWRGEADPSDLAEAGQDAPLPPGPSEPED